MGNIVTGPWDDSFELDPLVEARVAEFVDSSKLEKGHILQRIDRGREGLNVGISSRVPLIDKYTYGTHMGRYYLMGADSGVGKSTIADFMYVLNAYMEAKKTGRRLYLFYYSFEISRQEKTLRWISFFVYLLRGASIPSDYIDGKITGLPLTDAHYTMVKYATVYVEQMMKEIVFVEDPIHPTKIFHDLIEHHFEKVGKVIRKLSTDTKKKGTITAWEPNDPLAITLVVMDHMALLQPEQGFDTKQTMDLMSKYIVALRNIFNLSFLGVQQFNTEMTTYHRMNKKGDGMIAPQRIDFGDSRYTFRDADVVFGLIKPAIYDVDTYMGYNIKELKSYFVAAHLMKNRYGGFHHMLPLFVNPIAGYVKCLPIPPIDIAIEPFNKEVIELEKLIQFFTPKAV